MKIFSCRQTREIDQYTILNEPIEPIDLMERASNECCTWIKKHISAHNFHIYAGCGNNGGDGYAIARILKQSGKNVQIIHVPFSSTLSPDCKTNQRKAVKAGIVISQFGRHITPSRSSICIDAIFGSGLNRPAKGIALEAIKEANCFNTIIAIDIPSGMFGDDNRANSIDATVLADVTLTFQFPKRAFMLPHYGKQVGKLEILDINLHPEKLNSEHSDFYYTTKKELTAILQNRNKFAHKGTFGHALLFAGSKGKTGAAILAARSCLKSGTGLLTVLSEDSCYTPIQSAVPEAMFSSVYDSNQKYSAIGLGPGIGTGDIQASSLEHILSQNSLPFVLDADALNIIAQNKYLLNHLPENAIITPHPKEFERLFGTFTSDEERLNAQRELSCKHKIIIILKGRYTCITFPNNEVHFNSSGNPGMATAGSGDSLTGIILGLLSQGIEPFKTALLGAFIHGLAGDLATEKLGEISVTATDIINNIPEAFQIILQQKQNK